MARSLSVQQIVQLARQAGFRGRSAAIAAAVAMAESSGDPHNRYAPGPQEDSRGLMQINVVSGANPQYRNARLYDPRTNMRIAYKMSGGGKNWGPWTTYTSGKYARYMPAAIAANRRARANPSAGGVGPSTGGTSVTTTSLNPGRAASALGDYGQARQSLLMQFATARSQDPLTLALGLRDAKQGLSSGLAGAVQRTTTTTPGRASSGTSQGGVAPPGSEKGTAVFEGTRVAGWIAPILHYARAHGWKGRVNSGFRSYADQVRIYNSGVRPAARPGTSNHEGANFPRGAVDVSNAAQLSAIIHRSPYAGRLVWAGGKDPVHFSHPHGGSY